MEYQEYDYKLSVNNPVLTAKVISNILKVIQQKLTADSKRTCYELPEFKYLKQKCLVGDPTISLAAANGLVHLIRTRMIEVSEMLTDVTGMIPFAQNLQGLTMIVIESLLMDMRNKLESDRYICPFNLAIPQHPIISILAYNANVWSTALNYMKKLFQIEKQTHLTELLRPVYLYMLCDPHMKVSDLNRITCLMFMLENGSEHVHLIPEIIGWLQISSIENHMYSVLVFKTLHESDFVRENGQLRDLALFWMLSLLHEICTMKSDPTPILVVLSKLDLNSHRNIDYIMLFLAKCISIIHYIYLEDILKLCEKILPNSLHILTVLVLKASLINWMLCPSEALPECSVLLNHIYNRIKHISTTDVTSNFSNGYIDQLLNTNQQLYLIFQVYSAFDNELSFDQNAFKFLESTMRFSAFLLKHMIPFISGIFIYDTNQNNLTIKAMDSLLNHASTYSSASNSVLTIFLYKLTNSRDPDVQFEILKGLVKLGKAKENIHVVVSTLKTLGDTSPQMKTMVLTMYFELWKHEPKCYVLLQKMLIDENKLDKSNFVINKAYIVRELCKLKAELYGSELAVYISKIMNSCKVDNGIPTSFALEGLTHLCTKGVIDITTAWDTLEPSFRNETRSNVLVSFCKLLSELQNLHTETVKFNKMVENVIIKLWEYVLKSNDSKVVEAAYKALVTFDIENICEHYFQVYENKQLNQDFWFITLLKDNLYTNLDSTTNFIINCLSHEISEYGRGIYYANESKAEPSSYNYLPSKYILRGLMAHIKTNYSSRSELEAACFQILSHEFPKPLPPLDWCFLQEFIHHPTFRPYCIAIASHQVILSGTARRLIENLIMAITDNLNIVDLRCIISELKHLCNSIQPVIIKPFFKNTLNYALNLSDKDHSLLEFILCKVKEVMRKADLQDVNKNVLAEVLINKTDELHVNSKVFNKLMDCVATLPTLYLKPLITPKIWMEITPEKLSKACILCGYLAESAIESPMTYFNDLIDAIGDAEIGTEYFLNNLSNVAQELKHHDSLPKWFVELLGKTQLELTDSNTFPNHVSFMCDILIVTIISISDQKPFFKCKEIYMKQVINLLPQAFVLVLRKEKWNKFTTQVLEWLYYMINYKSTPVMYRKAFCQSLVSLRHQSEFKESHRWLRYVGCRIINND